MASIRAMTAAILVSAICVLAAPGHATLLRGYVSETQEQSETRDLSNQTITGSVRSDSLPAGFEGSWQCVTVVTESAVPSVPSGQKMVSDVQFVRKGDGRVVANWNQPGWTETQSSILTWSAAEGQVDRTNYFYGEKMNGAWAARSRDKFTQLDPDRIVAQSYVDQYIDGHYLGRYRTKSVLLRTAGAADLAMGNR